MREGGRLTLDQRLFFLDSVLRPADGQNRRRRKLASIPAELRHLEVKIKTAARPIINAPSSLSRLFFSSCPHGGQADRGSGSYTGTAFFSVRTFDTLIIDS